ncbi:DUF6286 domain-containing Asp23/Gls24 family envelope stress response protein [Streptomyces phaeochromogenes]|uniref:DUF6286 domain-containing Asp23/Gls24 family envelope stress response protein n=1 Tax=Streptomyces phaeochromogenes TaxID=1923 RepID=UPI003868F114|nr:alkaline shock response membrane anchor protein AmaP [Streptomyces phaeochromogenes]
MTAAAQRGTTTVSERAVRRIAERATTEALPAPGGARTAQAAASVRGRRAKVSLGVTLPYPAPLADTVREVQRHVVERTRELTGLEVPAARISVIALATPTSAQPLVSPTEDTIATSAPWRWWSQRRVPVAVLTSVAALGCGALALDMVQVHTAHLPASVWRTSAVHWLAGHGPGDPGVVVAGGLTALIGIWMVVLALTPGRRHQSTVHTSANHVDAAVDRSAVQSLVRDAVGDVEGIAAVRIRVRRRRVTVRAGLAFGDRAGAHAAATAAARAALTACHLRRAPRLRVVATPEPVWQPPAPTADVTADATGATPGDDDGRSTPASALAPATGGDR